MKHTVLPARARACAGRGAAGDHLATPASRRHSRTVAAITAAVTAAAAGIAWSRYRRALTVSLERIAAHSRIAATAAGPIEYGIAGAGAPALLIHGAGGGYDQGLIIARSLPPGLRSIAPSRFGYLATPLPADASPAAQADAHAALLDYLRVERAIVAGASAGAPSALELTIRYPGRVQALVLLVPRAYLPGGNVEVPMTPSNRQMLRVMLSGADLGYWLAMHLGRGRLVQFLGVPREIEARGSAAERARMTEIIESILPLSRRIAGIRNDSDTVLAPLPLERVRVPTLIVTARDDLFGTWPAAQFLAERIAGAKLVVLESGGHLFVGHDREVRQAVADFLAGAGLLA